MNNNLFEGGYVKKLYLPIGKQFVCDKERVIYKKNTNTDSSKVYMRHNAKYIQVVNFEKEMIVKGKWKLPTPIKQSNNKPNVKPCKADQYRNPGTGRCVKIQPAKPAKPAKPKWITIVFRASTTRRFESFSRETAVLPSLESATSLSS